MFDGKRMCVLPLGRPPKNSTRPRGAAISIACSWAMSLEQATMTTSAPMSSVAARTAAMPSAPEAGDRRVGRANGAGADHGDAVVEPDRDVLVPADRVAERVGERGMLVRE